MRKITHLFILSFLFCNSLTFGWWNSGHMVVAEIAEERLNENTKSKTKELIDELSPTCPDSTTFIEAACWLDDIQNRGIGTVTSWHGRAGPYSPDNFLSDLDFAKISIKYQNNDGIAAIQKSIATLKNPQAGKWEKAFMLRVLLHVVGDIHCPMHCVQLYSKQFPQGDKGGVRFTLTGPETLTLKHLHGLWDSIALLDTAWTPTHDTFRPLDTDANLFIKDLAKKITSAYPESSVPEKNNLCPETWAEESYILGKDAYTGIEINTTPSDEYIETAQKISCKRLALAGYRLAAILNECFPE